MHLQTELLKLKLKLLIDTQITKIHRFLYSSFIFYYMYEFCFTDFYYIS